MFRQNIILTGFMGTGKSTVGRIVAKRLNMKFIDIDEEIKKITGLNITKIFDVLGQRGFRDLETEVVEGYSEKKGFVIATGGGVVLRESNIINLRRNGIIFLLTADEQEILKRLDGSNDRPLLVKDGNNIIDMIKKRESRYYNTADYIVDTNNITAEDVAEKIIYIYSRF